MDELQEFDRYTAHLNEGLGHADRHAGLRGYCTGLMSPLQRKSVEPMAAHAPQPLLWCAGAELATAGCNAASLPNEGIIGVRVKFS